MATKNTIEEDIENVEKILDGISDKIPQTQYVLEKIKNVQIDIFELRTALERINFLRT